VLSRKAIVTGVVSLVVTLGGVAARAADGASGRPSRTVGVVDKTELPEKVADAHQRLQAALLEAARDLGWEPVISTAPPLDCDGKPACYSSAAAANGLGAILRVSGGRNSADGYDVTVQLATAAGGSRSVVGSCSFCVVADLARIAAAVAKEALAEPLPAPPPPPQPLPRAAEPSSVLMAPAPASPVEESGRRLLVPTVVGAASVALVGLGISFWVADGRSSGDCTMPSMGTRYCDLYDTRTVGQVLTGAGAVGVVVAGVLFYRALGRSHDVTVSVGPSGFAMGGRF